MKYIMSLSMNFPRFPFHYCSCVLTVVESLRRKILSELRNVSHSYRYVYKYRISLESNFKEVKILYMSTTLFTEKYCEIILGSFAIHLVNDKKGHAETCKIALLSTPSSWLWRILNFYDEVSGKSWCSFRLSHSYSSFLVWKTLSETLLPFFVHRV